MERGLHTVLAHNEVIALRRIAHGLAVSGDLMDQYVGHLKALGLVKADGNSLALTPLGERRVAQLPGNVGGLQK